MPSRTLRNYATFARLLLPAALALLASCAGSEHSAFYTVSTQPANVGDAGIAARAYHDSGAYDRDLAIVANQAARWITKRAANARRPALVLDIDETALSNWEIIKLDDFGRPIKGPCNPGSGAPCGWAAWDQLGRDPGAISPPTCAVVTPKRNFFCPTHSTAYPETLCYLLFLLNPGYVLRSVPEAGHRNV